MLLLLLLPLLMMDKQNNSKAAFGKWKNMCAMVLNAARHRELFMRNVIAIDKRTAKQSKRELALGAF